MSDQSVFPPLSAAQQAHVQKQHHANMQNTQQYQTHHLAQQHAQQHAQQQGQMQHQQNNASAAYANANTYQVKIPDRGSFQAQQQMQPFEFSPQYPSHDFARSRQMAITGQHQSRPQQQHGQLGGGQPQQVGHMGRRQNEYTQQHGQGNQLFGRMGQNKQVGVNERGLIIYKPQGIDALNNIAGNPQAFAQQHFQTPPGFAQMNTQQPSGFGQGNVQQPPPQAPEPYGYQYGGFGPAPQSQSQAQTAHAHYGQAQGLAQGQGYNQFPNQGLFDDVQGQRLTVRLPSVTVTIKTPGKKSGITGGTTTAATPSNATTGAASKASASKAAYKPVEKAKGTMINGLFYPEGQSPAEKAAAAAKKKNPFVAKEPDREYFPISPSWELSDYELTGAWNTLPSAERTPPAALRLARLAEADPSSLTCAERLELETARATQNSVGDQGPFGAAGGQGALNYTVVPVQPGQQYNAFGAPLAGGAAASTGQVGGHVWMSENHEEHMSRSEMVGLGAFFDMVMQPGKQRKTWGYTDGPNGGDGDNDDDDEDDDGGNGGNGCNGPENKTPTVTGNDKGKEPCCLRTRDSYDSSQRCGPPPPGFGGRDTNCACGADESPAPTSQRKPKKTSLFGPKINPFAPLAQQLGLPPAFYTNTSNQQSVLPSALPTRHVSHGLTNFDRGGATTSSRTASESVGPGSNFDTGRRLFSQHQQQQQVKNRDEVPMSYGPLTQRSDTALPNQWKSAETAILDEYKHVTNHASHLHLTQSPAFPASPGQFASVRGDQKERAADLLKDAIAVKEALLTEEGRKEKELLDQANRAAYGWAEANAPLQQAIGNAYTVNGFGARRFKGI